MVQVIPDSVWRCVSYVYDTATHPPFDGVQQFHDHELVEALANMQTEIGNSKGGTGLLSSRRTSADEGSLCTRYLMMHGGTRGACI